MKTKLNFLAAGLFLAAANSALAGTARYVNVHSASPTPPYTNWPTAAGRTPAMPGRSRERGRRLLLGMLMPLFLMAAPSLSSAGIIYVDAGATGNNSGSSWAEAFTTLQGALQTATSGDSVWVAQGVYHPGTSREDSFRLGDGVQVYGGFKGTESELSSRDPQAHPTVLSGDNCYHVIINSGIGSASVWDGFTITGGNADGSPPDNKGGGMYNDTAMPKIQNCIFEYNGGSGMHNLSSSALVSDCIFRGNTAFDGAGITDSASSTTVINCLFETNSAAYDAGVTMVDHCLSTFSNCVFRGNSVYDSGGAMGIQSGSAPQIVACTFEGNVAQYGSAGAIWNWYDAFPVIDRCLFKGNVGGAIYNRQSSVLLANCIFVDNVGRAAGGAIDNTEASVALVRNCTFVHNSAPQGKAIATEDVNSRPSQVQLINSILWDGADEIWNGDASSITVSYSDIWGGYTGDGNLNQDPQFVGPDDFHLRLGSRCINAGTNAYVVGSTDLDGRPRIVGGTVDIGAYEFQPSAPGRFITWLQQYGLAADGSADYLDADGDGLNNWQEWRCGTCPTNSLSVLRMLSVTNAVSGVTVSWQSVAGVKYFLECGTNLSATPCFTSVATNVPGQAGKTTYTDTNAVGAGPFFYRVGVGN